jgi:diadenosine tetraphosphate (Ap4A) HIT family hydrolase
MPESPEDLYARVVDLVGEEGRLPMPPVEEWEMFPWEVVDGRLAPKVLRPPVATEEARWGETESRPCGSCAGDQSSYRIWHNERWFVSSPPEPKGLPLVLMLQSREHLDFTDMDDDLAAEYGRLSVRLCRIMSNLPHVGRVHVCRWGDGGSHLHVWFIARPERLPGLIGSLVVEWDEMLPPPPEEIWRADLAAVARRLANYDGRALV